MDATATKLMEALQLSEYEVRLYVAGLEYEQATLTDLGELADIPRTAAYPPLKTLLKRGLMTKIQKGKRVLYRSVDPKQLPHILEAQKVKLNMAIESLARIVSVPKNDFSAQYFSGTHGLKTAADLFLESTAKGGEWYSFENPMFSLEKIGNEYFTDYIARRVRLGIRARMIATIDTRHPWIQERLKKVDQELIDVITISPNEYPLDASIVTNKSMVLMLSARGIPFTLLIQNQLLAHTFVSIHRMVWDRYKR